ncbi:hypothetical protein GYMLUDRAFT_169927, partial [Collybiopsis luxurians FD-317 M1]
LTILHRAGWVHRDISISNLYYWSDTDMGIIGDLEYARKVDGAHRGHIVRTGTPCFMACEAISHGYLFITQLKADAPLPCEPETNLRKQDATSGSTPDPVFYYHGLHDLESVWWVIVWIMCFNDDPQSPCPNPSLRQQQAEGLFAGKMDITHRMLFIGAQTSRNGFQPPSPVSPES